MSPAATSWQNCVVNKDRSQAGIANAGLLFMRAKLPFLGLSFFLWITMLNRRWLVRNRDCVQWERSLSSSPSSIPFPQYLGWGYLFESGYVRRNVKSLILKVSDGWLGLSEKIDLTSSWRIWFSTWWELKGSLKSGGLFSIFVWVWVEVRGEVSTLKCGLKLGVFSPFPWHSLSSAHLCVGFIIKLVGKKFPAVSVLTQKT